MEQYLLVRLDTLLFLDFLMIKELRIMMIGYLIGDLLVYYSPLEQAVELSSMGIRVDATSLEQQLAAKGQLERLSFPLLLVEELDSLGLLCFFSKKHIFEKFKAQFGDQDWSKNFIKQGFSSFSS